MDAYRPRARVLDRVRSFGIATQRALRSARDRIQTPDARDRRRDLLLGLAAGSVAAVSVAIFVEVTDPDLEPLLPRLGTVFTVAVGPDGQRYIALDPSTFTGEEGGSPANGGRQQKAEVSPILLFPLDTSLLFDGSAPGGSNPPPSDPAPGSGGEPAPGGGGPGPRPGPAPPEEDPPVGPGPDPDDPPTDPIPGPGPPPEPTGPTGPGPTGPVPTGPTGPGPTGPDPTGPTGPGATGPDPTGPDPTGPGPTGPTGPPTGP